MNVEQMLTTLQNYTVEQKRDTWVFQGSKEADDSMQFYSAGLVYKVNKSTSDVHNYVVFCMGPIPSPIDWDKYQYVNNSLQHIDTLHIPTEIVVIVTPSEWEAIVDPVDVSFIPFQEGTTEFTAPSVIVDEAELHLILSEAGVPFIKWEELEYTKDQLKYLVIKPALDHYYKYFPLIKRESTRVDGHGKFSFDFPSDPHYLYVNNVVGDNSGDQETGQGLSPFRYYGDTIIGNLTGVPMMGGSRSSRSRKSRGNGPMNYDYNDLTSRILSMQAYKSLRNNFARVKYTIDLMKGKLEGYHTGKAFVTVEWAFSSPYFDKIPHARKLEVRDLCKAYALRLFASLREQQPSNSPGKVDYSKWFSRADELEKNTLNHWIEFTKAVVVKSS